MSKLNYTGYIYKIENLINNHLYIGKTNNPRRRWNEHIREHSTCSILKKAFRKYGINNFRMVILLEIKASSIENLNTILNALEPLYIKKYNTFKNGYNATSGGEGICNYKMSEITKRKISNALKGRILSEERRKQCGLANKGKHHSKEVCERIRLALLNRDKSIYEKIGLKLRGRKRDKDIIAKGAIKRRKPILQYTLDGKFIQEYAGSSFISNMNNANIISCCKGKISSAYGYIWRYKNNNFPIDLSTPTHQSNKQVIQYTLDNQYITTFKSIAQASRQTGICASAISNCLNKKSKSAGNFKWIFKERSNYE